MKNFRLRVFSLTFFFGALLTALAVVDHRNGNSGLFDLGLFEQVLYRWTHGHGMYSSVLGKNLLGDHVCFILYLLGVVYAAFPFTETLLILQSFALAFGFYLTVTLAKASRLKMSESLIWGCLYILNPCVFYINLWDFHPLVFAIPLLIAALVMEKKGLWKWALFLYAMTLLLKEEMGLVVGGIGFVWFVFRRKRLLGAILLAMGLVFFWVSIHWIMPAYSEGTLPHLERYAQFGKSFADIGKTLTLHPLESLNGSTTIRKLFTLMVLLIPFFVFPFLGWRTLLYAVVPLLYNYLSNVVNQFDFRAHYMSVLFPFVLVSAIEGRGRCLRVFPFEGVGKKILVFMIGFTAIMSPVLYFNIAPISARSDLRYPIAFKSNPAMFVLNEALQKLDPSTPLVVSNALGSHVARTKDLYLFSTEIDPVVMTDYALLVDINASDPWPFTRRKDHLKWIKLWVKNRKMAFNQDGLLLLIPGKPDRNMMKDVIKIINHLIYP